jgi:hypothetical protein
MPPENRNIAATRIWRIHKITCQAVARERATVSGCVADMVISLLLSAGLEAVLATLNRDQG